MAERKMKKSTLPRRMISTNLRVALDSPVSTAITYFTPQKEVTGSARSKCVCVCVDVQSILVVTLPLSGMRYVGAGDEKIRTTVVGTPLWHCQVQQFTMPARAHAAFQLVWHTVKSTPKRTQRKREKRGFVTIIVMGINFFFSPHVKSEK